MPRRSAGVDPNQSPAPHRPARRTPRTCIHAKMPPRSRCRNALRRTIARRRSTRPSRRAAERCSIVGEYVRAGGGGVAATLGHRDARSPRCSSTGALSSGCSIAAVTLCRGSVVGMPDHRDARSPGCALSGILGRRVTPPPEYCVALRAAPSERREASAGRPTAIAAAIGRNRERQRFRRSRPSPRSRAITRYPPHTARRPPHVACRPPPAAGREPA